LKSFALIPTNAAGRAVFASCKLTCGRTALIYAHLAGQRLCVTLMPMRAIGALPEMEK
jgi:hypothetical protein